MGTLARVTRNALALTTSLALERGLSFVLFLFIARRLGTDALGEYALALSFLAVFETVSVFGQNLLVVREVAQNHGSARQYMVNSSAIVLVAALLCALVMPRVARLLGYPPETIYYVLLAGLVLIPDSLAVVPESVLQGWERMEFITLFRFATNLLGTGASVIMLVNGAGLAAVFYVLLAQRTALAASYSLLVWRRSLPGARLWPDWHFCRKLAQVSMAFLGMNVCAAIFKNVDVWILRGMTDATEVGIYSAADRPIAFVGLLAPILMIALFPSLAQTYRSAPERFARILEVSLRGLAAAIPGVALILSLAAPRLVALLYGAEYSKAVLPMQILAWSLVPTFTAALFFRVLLSSNNERVSLYVAFINMMANVGLNLMLIPRWGAVGASVSALITGMLGLVQNYWLVNRRVVKVRTWGAFAKPALGLLMAAVVYLLFPAGWPPFLRSGLITLVYLVVLAVTGAVTRHELQLLIDAVKSLGDRTASVPARLAQDQSRRT